MNYVGGALLNLASITGADVGEKVEFVRSRLVQHESLGCCYIEEQNNFGLSNFHFVKVISNKRFNEWGRGVTREEAMLGALMERVERISAIQLPEHVDCSSEEAEEKGRVVDLEQLGKCNFQRISKYKLSSTPVRYIDVVGDDGNAKFFAPTSRVFLRASAQTADHSCSTGLAAHFELEEARKRAALECIERHYHHVSKFNDVEFDNIDLSDCALPENLANLLSNLAEEGFVVSVLFPRIASKIYLVWIYIRKNEDDSSKYPFHSVFHFAAHQNFGTAVERALTEALVGRFLADESRNPKFERKRNRFEVLFLERVTKAIEQTALSPPVLGFDFCSLTASRMISELGGDVYFKDLTHPKIGIPVVRVLATRLQPNFDLLGFDPLHSRSRITPHLSIFDECTAKATKGEFSDLSVCSSSTVVAPKQVSPFLLRSGASLSSKIQNSKSELSKVISNRRSCRSFERGTLEQFATVLFKQSFGVPELVYSSSGGFSKRRNFPSGGARHSLEFYCMFARRGSFEIFHFSPSGTLVHCTNEVPTSAFEELCKYMRYARCENLMIISSVPERTRAKYGRSAEKLIYIEAGHAAQNFVLVCEQYGFGSLPLGMLGDNIHLSTDESEIVIYSVAFGKKGEHKFHGGALA